MKAPTFVREGDSLICSWPDDSVGIAFEHFRESSGELKAEVTVQLDLGGPEGGLLSWGLLNLSSTRSRDELAKKLSTRLQGFEWHLAIDSACTRAVREYRRGEPIVSLRDVEVPPATQHLLYPILPEDETTIWFGDGGTGKSLLALHAAVAVRQGLEIAGLRPRISGPVLYLDWETNAAAHARRLRLVMAGLGLEDVPDVHYRPSFRPLAEDVALLRQEVARSRYRLVIIDSLAACCGDEPKDAGVALRTMNAIRSLGATRLVIAHITKDAAGAGNGQSAPASVFGSVFFRNYARSTWELRSAAAEVEDGHNPIALFHRKSNDDKLHKQPIGLRFEFGEGSVSLVRAELNESSPLVGSLPLGARIRAILRAGRATVDELSESTGASTESVRTTLRRMPGVGRLDDQRAAGGRGNSGSWGLLAPEPETPPQRRQEELSAPQGELGAYCYCGDEVHGTNGLGELVCKKHFQVA